MAQINKPSAPLVPPTTDADVENIVNEAIATDDTHASLVNGEVPSTQLPSYVDDVLEFDDADEFPAEGETGKIYVALDTNYTYRWSGAAYVQVGGASLGEGNGIEINNDLVSVKFAEVESGLNFNGNNELVVDFNTVTDHVAGSGGGFIYSTESHYLDVRVDQIQETLQNNDHFQTWVDERAEAVAAAAAPSYFDGSGSLAYEWLHDHVDSSLSCTFDQDDGMQLGVDNYWFDGAFDTRLNGYINDSASALRVAIYNDVQQGLGTLATVATSGAYSDLSGTPDIVGSLNSLKTELQNNRILEIPDQQTGTLTDAQVQQLPYTMYVKMGDYYYQLTSHTSGRYYQFRCECLDTNFTYWSRSVNFDTQLKKYEKNTTRSITIYDRNDIVTALAGKQNTISDLATIRSGATAGATALQPADVATVATSGSYADLSNKPTILSAQDVQDMIDASINSVLNQGF